MISPPNGLDADNAPASAYLQAVPNCRLHFVALSGSDNGDKWFCCCHCKSKDVPIDQHVGDIFDEDGSVKPVSDWDMAKPEPISALANHYEKHQISLCRLFSKTVRDAGVSQYKHIQGEVNSVKKLDRHYYGLFGFLACKSQSHHLKKSGYVRHLSSEGLCRYFSSLVSQYTSSESSERQSSSLFGLMVLRLGFSSVGRYSTTRVA